MTQPLPDFFIIKTFDMDGEQNVVASESRDKKTIQRRVPGHRWAVRMRLEVRPADAKKAAGWLANMQRDNQFCTYTDPIFIGTGNKTTNGSRSSGSEQVAFTSIAGVEVYDYLNFANHDKLYQIVEINANTVTLNTPLANDVPGSTTVNTSSPTVLLELPPELKRSLGLQQRTIRDLGRANLRFIEAT